MTEPLDPDCEVGKHAACSGRALDPTTDELTPCACPCHRQEALFDWAIILDRDGSVVDRCRTEDDANHEASGYLTDGYNVSVKYLPRKWPL